MSQESQSHFEVSLSSLSALLPAAALPVREGREEVTHVIKVEM